MFLVGDQPFINAATINLLIAAFKQAPHDIIIPVYNGRRGARQFSQQHLKDDLLALEGDRGGRMLIEKYAGESKTG